jgi:choline dehydrogenase-like flavoprotein
VSVSRAADVVVVGAGVAGLLVARELARGGRSVTLIERGGLASHAEQLRSGRHEVTLRTAEHNHETAPGSPDYPWDYAYGVGGSTLLWTGIATRFLPADFELRSRYGIGVDWPFGYPELEPFYTEAEVALAVAGGSNPLLPGLDGRDEIHPPHLQPPHPPSRVDALLRPLLSPWVEVQQARPTLAVAGRPACCGSARCRLCPVDARFSGLHLWDSLAEQVSLLSGTVVSRLRSAPGGVAVECVGEMAETGSLRARSVVLAAGGIENAAILLRSSLGGEDVGRGLFDHAQRAIEIELDTPVDHGYGTTLATGVSYAYADGDWRTERGSLLVCPYNPGRFPTAVAADLAQQLGAGRRGKDAIEAVRARFRHTLVLSVTGEDLPDPSRSVTLSPTHDRLGLPLNRIAYGDDSPYLVRGFEHAVADLRERLGSLGVRAMKAVGATTGAHQLGSCAMGRVVDGDLLVRGAGSVYAVGGSAFPTYSAAWPTLTIGALAIRLGRQLASG